MDGNIVHFTQARLANTLRHMLQLCIHDPFCVQYIPVFLSRVTNFLVHFNYNKREIRSDFSHVYLFFLSSSAESIG